MGRWEEKMAKAAALQKAGGNPYTGVQKLYKPRKPSKKKVKVLPTATPPLF